MTPRRLGPAPTSRAELFLGWTSIGALVGKPPCRPTYARKRGFTLLEMMVAIDFTVANQLLRLKLRADKKRYGSERPETFSLESVTSLRN